MKKLFTLAAIALSLSANAQKKDSLILEIKMDTATFKFITSLIRENIDGRTATGQTILNNILTPLYQFALVPREKQTAKKEEEIKSNKPKQ